MKKLKEMGWLPIFILLVLFIAPFPADVFASEGGIALNIRFFDKRVYYVEGDPIKIHITITNNTSSTYRFKLADERAFSLDFDVRTLTNKLLSTSEELIRKRTQYQQIYFREISIEAGESFSFLEELRSYIKIAEPGDYVVKVKMYPELFRHDNISILEGGASANILESSGISLSVRPSVIIGQDGIPVEMDTATGSYLFREKLSPDKVVDYMLSARQKSQWEKFFLYLDLESMLKQDSEKLRKWNNENEEGKKRMVDAYKAELRNTIIDGTISVIPNEYTIERTQYTSFDATVSVMQVFKYTNYSEMKRYTYFLHQKDGIWSIVNYSVSNQGTR